MIPSAIQKTRVVTPVRTIHCRRESEIDVWSLIDDDGGACVTAAFEAARRNPMVGLLACAAGFALALVLGYWIDPFPGWDEDLLLAVRSAPRTFANDLAFAVERLVSPAAQVGWTVLAGLLAFWLRRPRRAFAAVAEVAGTAVLVQLLKIALEHPRFRPGPDDPFFWHPVAKSFPSGNSAGALAIALAFLLVVPRPWRPAIAAMGAAFTLAVSVCLLVLDYHYPSDILGGWMVALGWCFALDALQHKQNRHASPAGLRRTV
jgi:membrane-associated phospholipid phosphatase